MLTKKQSKPLDERISECAPDNKKKKNNSIVFPMPIKTSLIKSNLEAKSASIVESNTPLFEPNEKVKIETEKSTKEELFKRMQERMHENYLKSIQNGYCDGDDDDYCCDDSSSDSDSSSSGGDNDDDSEANCSSQKQKEEEEPKISTIAKDSFKKPKIILRRKVSV